MLSIVPGLGQLRNGEIAKGGLFLLCALASAGIEAALVIGKAPVAAQILYMLLVISFVGYTMRDAYDRGVQIVRDKKQPNKFSFSLPEAASGSYLFHAALMVAFAIAVFMFVQKPPQKEQVTVIELVQPDKPKPPALAKHEPKRDTPKPKAIEPKPIVEPKPVVKPVVQPKPVVVPPKPAPTPVAVAVPTTAPTPLTTAPAAAPPASDPTPAPAASSGGGAVGGTGTGGGDGGGGEVDMGPWMRAMQRKIKKSWFPPKGQESMRIKVSFKVHKDGSVGKVKLISSSGVSTADDAALQAISDASPFAALPDGVGDEIDINFTFDYNVFGGRH
jgi:protein TonB